MELPLTVQSVSVVVRPTPPATAADAVGGVVADGAAGQRGRASFGVQAAAVEVAELPLTVQLVSVVVPEVGEQAAALAGVSCR